MSPTAARVLITGANGFTGGHLYPLLCAAGLDVIPMNHHAVGMPNEVVVDFDSDHVTSSLQDLPAVDVVVHLGARIGWEGGTRAELFRPNVLATAQLAAWAKQRNAYFIFASAALIAGPTNPYISAASGWELQTHNDYLYSKWLAEQMIAMSGVEATLLRIAGIYGANGPTHLGLNRTIRDALKGMPPVLFGDGLIKRNYIYVKDLCAIIHWLIENPLCGTYLAAGSYHYTMVEMMNSICQILVPNTEPEIRPVGNGHHQIVQHSPQLPAGRTFVETLKDILNHYTAANKSTRGLPDQ